MIPRAKIDATHQGWENTEFPIVCENCLGDSAYVRMTKQSAGGACKTCERPFTVFRWKPGPKARFKKTEVCQLCARVKNVCQTCILDLNYGVPVEVRDKVLAEAASVSAGGGSSGLGASQALVAQTYGNIPTNSGVNRTYALMQAERSFDEDGPLTTTGNSAFANISTRYPAAHATLLRLGRSKTYYDRNQAKLCSFYAKGECNRGDECPYRHEMPKGDRETNPLAVQNLKDRYFGAEDPVAAKMLGRLHGGNGLLGNGSGKAPEPPEDPTATTLWIAGLLDDRVKYEDLRASFQPFGDVKDIKIVLAKQCAFVEFFQRANAEAAAASLYSSLAIGGLPLHVGWARPRGGGGGEQQQQQVQHTGGNQAVEEMRGETGRRMGVGGSSSSSSSGGGQYSAKTFGNRGAIGSGGRGLVDADDTIGLVSEYNDDDDDEEDEEEEQEDNDKDGGKKQSSSGNSNSNNSTQAVASWASAFSALGSNNSSSSRNSSSSGSSASTTHAASSTAAAATAGKVEEEESTTTTTTVEIEKQDKSEGGSAAGEENDSKEQNTKEASATKHEAGQGAADLGINAEGAAASEASSSSSTTTSAHIPPQPGYYYPQHQQYPGGYPPNPYPYPYPYPYPGPPPPTYPGYPYPQPMMMMGGGGSAMYPPPASAYPAHSATYTNTSIPHSGGSHHQQHYQNQRPNGRDVSKRNGGGDGYLGNPRERTLSAPYGGGGGRGGGGRNNNNNSGGGSSYYPSMDSNARGSRG